ncbi:MULTISPECIES: hypothetical protein [Roseomonadaceae]|uniref:Resolvase/invertase-type recombinase catalytic domain-containing protein n=1 Tax=Falsiroseomonas oleicola TaxID=2801474 RepID=A0ABS6H6M6_9PROT|nr:hypothetical protein [Roseomonas oleicola]MBU8544011.1 hypothetical protein [Roseomonas oleicola]
MRLVYLCERKGLPSLADQRAALAAAGLTEAEMAEAYLDRAMRKPRPGEAAQPERDHIIGSARPGDEVWVSRPAVIATMEDEALRFLAKISEHGAVLCIASTGDRYSVPPEAKDGVAAGLRLAADIKADERKAVMERARQGSPGRPAGKARISADRLEAARAIWFNHDLSGPECAARTGIGQRTLARHFGKRGTPAFGAALNKRRGKT